MTDYKGQNKRDIREMSYKKKRKTHRFRLLILFAVLIVLLTAFIIGSCVWLYTTRVRSERTQSATGAAKIAEHIIDPDKVEEYLHTDPKDKTNTEYQKMLDDLYSVRDNTVGLKYLYVVRIQEDGCCFIIDLESDDTEAYEPGTVVEIEDAFDPYLDDLYAGREIAPIESKDEFGWLITIYYPVRNDKGVTTCYIGADVSMTDVEKNITDFLLWTILISGAFLLAELMIALWVTRQYQKTAETEELLHKKEQDSDLLEEIVMAFVKTVDMKDKYTNGHSFRVARYTAMLAKELGYDEETIQNCYTTALMHDIGKIGIPDEVLNKPGKLTDEEFALIKSHTSLGYDVLKGISIRSDLAEGARSHHERPDGKGYPMGLKGDEIPRVAQIIAVADTFDAMYSNRPYRKRMNFDKVVSIIKDVSGTQLTSDVVDAFLRLVEKGKFRAADDHGGGSMEDIDNIRKGYEAENGSQKKPNE